MPDVAYTKNRQGWSFKALNDKARKAMGKELGGPWQMAAEVYWSCVTDEKFESILAKLRDLGLDVPSRTSGAAVGVVESEKRPDVVDVSKYLA